MADSQTVEPEVMDQEGPDLLEGRRWVVAVTYSEPLPHPADMNRKRRKTFPDSGSIWFCPDFDPDDPDCKYGEFDDMDKAKMLEYAAQLLHDYKKKYKTVSVAVISVPVSGCG
jgi:hypothetical protein